ncbi:MAG: hypothetical protein Q8P67_29145, partial [archaeon]|nr:hypothetical protein [archaeon]
SFCSRSEDGPAEFQYFEVLPPYLRFYFSGMRGHEALQEWAFQPPEDRVQAGWLFLRGALAPLQCLSVHVPFEKVFLAWTEFPPDAHQGSLLGSGVLLDPLLGRRSYVEPLLVMLPTPDFSMPYNVIMIAGTLISLFFGTVFNRLRKRHRYLRLDGAPDPNLRPLARLIRYIRSRFG